MLSSFAFIMHLYETEKRYVRNDVGPMVPGAKTRRIMASNLKLVDIVVELCDARIPQSSRNPEIDKIVGKKPRLMLLNKADCADAAATEQWLTYYRKKGIPAMACDCRSGRGVKNLLPAVREVLADKIAAWNEKGMVGRPIRMMIVGIPNVGKSSLINRLSGTRSAKVEDRPGVTRGKQWVSLEDGVELLDMPGVLWPKFEDKVAGERLAFIGSVKDQILDIEYLAMRLLDTLRPTYTAALAERYKLDAEAIAEMESYELLERIARKRGMLISGGEANTERAAIMLLDEFRSGAMGRITLERIPQ